MSDLGSFRHELNSGAGNEAMTEEFDFTPVRFAVVGPDLAVVRWGECAKGDALLQGYGPGERALILAADAPPPAGMILDLESGVLIEPPTA